MDTRSTRAVGESQTPRQEEDHEQQQGEQEEVIDEEMLLSEENGAEQGDDDLDDEEQDEDDDEDEIEEQEDDSDPDSDDSKSEGELEAIQYEMQELMASVPALNGQYRLVSRLGEGTFSSVYKAVDLLNCVYDNSLWEGAALTSNHRQDRPLSKPKGVGKVYVALKRIYVTSSPIRIFNELDILNMLRGASNVAFLISAIRYEDQVIAVMPFNRHQDFRVYYRSATLPLLRSYFSALFEALKATHNLSIIHRDVKPANFLYNRETATGVLCDFGLAQKIGGYEWSAWTGECLHSLPSPAVAGLTGVHRREAVRAKMEHLEAGVGPGLLSGLHGAKMLRPVPTFEQVCTQELEWNNIDNTVSTSKAKDPCNEPWYPGPAVEEEMAVAYEATKAWYKDWTSASVGTSSSSKRERVGYLTEDRRPNVRANRAGTRGFRAPEVLFKCPDQTVALDIWSAGIILLCFLTRRFPFFNSNDDTEALVEIAAIFGKKKIEKCAVSHNRTFSTNIPSLESPAHPSLHALVKSLNPPIFVENSPDPFGPIPSSAESDAAWYEGSELYDAVDFMKRCLELEGTRRWTAEDLLEHDFLKGEMDQPVNML